jgi:hypothetical protein
MHSTVIAATEAGATRPAEKEEPMETTELTQTTVEPKHEKVTYAVGLGGSAVEALAGVAAVVLSILGLAGRLTVPFASVAMIATGVALLFEAATVAARRRKLWVPEHELERVEVGSGIGADSIAGIGAITLGILSLIGIEPRTLLPVATIVLGAGLLLSAATPAVRREAGVTRRGEIVRETLAASSGVHVLVGTGAVVLGIVGVLGNAPILMTLIATLSIGAAQLLTGASMGARMSSLLHHGA